MPDAAPRRSPSDVAAACLYLSSDAAALRDRAPTSPCTAAARSRRGRRGSEPERNHQPARSLAQCGGAARHPTAEATTPGDRHPFTCQVLCPAVAAQSPSPPARSSSARSSPAAPAGADSLAGPRSSAWRRSPASSPDSAAPRRRAAGHAACSGKFRAVRGTNGHVSPMLVTSATGYGPADIRSAYKLTSAHGSGRTVAIVDAYDDPNAQADLSALPQPLRPTRLHDRRTAASTRSTRHRAGRSAARGRPRLGRGDQPRPGHGRRQPARTATSCSSRPNSTGDTDLMAAEDAASASAGVVAVSNSYGGSEDRAITGVGQALPRTRESRTPQAPATAATARSGRPPRRTSPRSAGRH